MNGVAVRPGYSRLASRQGSGGLSSARCSACCNDHHPDPRLNS